MKNNICDILRERIVNLSYKPGDPLNENKLAQEFGVSRTPIREAIIRLSEESLVTIIANIGTRVADINIYDFQKLIEMRLILEKGVAILAVKNATEEQIQDLERLYDRINRLKDEDISELIECDRVFHRIIDQASHNQLLAKFLSIIRNQFFRIQKLISHKPERMRTDLSKVIEAFKKRNEDEMVLLMVDHVEHFVEKVRNYF